MKYVSDTGKVFDTKEECEKYESQLNKSTEDAKTKLLKKIKANDDKIEELKAQIEEIRKDIDALLDVQMELLKEFYNKYASEAQKKLYDLMEILFHD